MFNTIDLFAGAGGLSLGFIQTGAYDIKVAFENNPCMQETYRKNHSATEVMGDVCKADFHSLKEKYGDIDVVIGGPPCQGFSNANRQKNHVINQNNMLVKQYIRAIRELRPKAFILENVSMLGSDTHRFFFNKDDAKDIKKYGIPTIVTRISLLDGRFLFPDVLTFLNKKEVLEFELWPDELYNAMNVVYKAPVKDEKKKTALEKHQPKIEKYIDCYKKTAKIGCEHIHRKSEEAFDAIMAYYAGNVNENTVNDLIEPAIMFQRMLGKIKEIKDNRIIVERYEEDGGVIANIQTYSILDYLRHILGSGKNSYSIDADVLCASDFGAPQKRERFVIMGIKKSLKKAACLPKGTFTEDKYRTVRDAIEDLETVCPVIDVKDDKGLPVQSTTPANPLGAMLRNSKVLYNHVITNTGDDAMARFKALKQGENFHSLDESLKTNTYTDVARTQNTIYLRLDYDQPCGTVVNVRKSMWVHPTIDRAISIREAARLQTFPDSFVFCGTKDKQYQQVGNAVPPIMARALAEQLLSILGD